MNVELVDCSFPALCAVDYISSFYPEDDQIFLFKTTFTFHLDCHETPHFFQPIFILQNGLETVFCLQRFLRDDGFEVVLYLGQVTTRKVQLMNLICSKIYLVRFLHNKDRN